MDPLQELISALPARPQAVAKIRYSHDAMIDQIIAAPAISQGQLAAMFGYTQAWVSQIIATDAFQARLAERKDELVDPAIRASIEERFRALVQRSLEVLQQKLSKPADEVSDMLALKASELGAKALGIGQVSGPTPSPVPADVRLAALANNLTGLLAARRTTTVVEEVRVSQPQVIDAE